MEYHILFILVAIGQLPCCSTHENELCYLRRSDAESVLCTLPNRTVPCCFEDIRVTVYGDEHCDSTACGNSNFNCCARTSQINISEQYRSKLEQTFRSSNCFKSVVPLFGYTLLPFNLGLDLVVVSYSCQDKTETTTTHSTTLSIRTDKTDTRATSPTTLHIRRDTSSESTTTSPTAPCTLTDANTKQTTTAMLEESTTDANTKQTTTVMLEESTTGHTQSKDTGLYVGVSVSVVVVVVAVACITIFLVRRRISRKKATEQPIHTNNTYTGSVSKAMGLKMNDYPSIKANDPGMDDDYAEIADSSVNFNHSSAKDNYYQTIKPIKMTVNNVLTKDKTKDIDPTREDEYDHFGTKTTPKSHGNNMYEHISHISKTDGTSTLYDESNFNQVNTNSFDEDNYNHTSENGAEGGTETDDRNGGYSHVGGTVWENQAADQYSTVKRAPGLEDQTLKRISLC